MSKRHRDTCQSTSARPVVVADHHGHIAIGLPPLGRRPTYLDHGALDFRPSLPGWDTYAER